ncbi:MAG TPA: hypothetical protein VIJ76_04625 [Galbitalea sp.]
MPKTLRERLDHLEALAKVFEDYEPRTEDERDVAPRNALMRAVERRAAAERDIADGVAAMRAANYPWWSIGEVLGTTGQAAQQRYGKR